MEPTIIPVQGATPYDVVVGRGLTPAVVERARSIGARKALVLVAPPLAAAADKLAADLGASHNGLEAHVEVLPDAESCKSIDVLAHLWDVLGEKSFSRSDVLIGLGGGATTDLAGFVAATWMRGIKVIQVPTTLLAMVDAAVGGKTGINTAAGKNLVGAFHEPDSVFVDLDVLDALPQTEIVAGSAEIIKCGFIADDSIIAAYFADPQACLDPHQQLPTLIAKAIQIKADVVSQDLKESGLREILNYGHTFGHAIELREHYEWRHGHAVAVGMMFVAHLAHQVGMLSADVVSVHKNVLESVGLPTSYAPDRFPELRDAMSRDKKNRDGALRFVVLEAIGSPRRLDSPDEADVRAAYDAITR